MDSVCEYRIFSGIWAVDDIEFVVRPVSSVIGQCYGQSLPVQESRVVESVGCGGCYSCENPVGVEPAEGSCRVQRLFGLVQLIPIFGTGE